MSQSARTPTRNPYLPRPKRRFGALAWVALALGILGLGGAALPMAAQATAVAALVGLLLGVIALFGARKFVAGLASLLCVAALAATVFLQGLMFGELNRVLFGSPPQPPISAPPVVRLPFGERHSWPTGVTMSILPPSPYVETSESSRPPAGKRHVQFDVVVRNDGRRGYNVVTSTITVSHRGRVAQQHFGAGDPVPMAPLRPGAEVDYTMVVEIDAEPGELEVGVRPGFAAQETALFVGAV